eukprot:GHVS01038038.1.p1 GENE.GHVS01038038.1~~GHVS01038038.1.p1  ORF type:complete len:798 (+),score=140.04 GHVS01038038.1:214-2607(+)
MPHIMECFCSVYQRLRRVSPRSVLPPAPPPSPVRRPHLRVLLRLFLFSSSLLFMDFLFSKYFLLRFIRFTNIDWTAYMQQVKQVASSEYNYYNIQGETGPLVYPAGHVYIYMLIRWWTNGGTDIPTAQTIFMYIYYAQLAFTIVVYISSPLLYNSTVNIFCPSFINVEMLRSGFHKTTKIIYKAIKSKVAKNLKRSPSSARRHPTTAAGTSPKISLSPTSTTTAFASSPLTTASNSPTTSSLRPALSHPSSSSSRRRPTTSYKSTNRHAGSTDASRTASTCCIGAVNSSYGGSSDGSSGNTIYSITDSSACRTVDSDLSSITACSSSVASDAALLLRCRGIREMPEETDINRSSGSGDSSSGDSSSGDSSDISDGSSGDTTGYDSDTENVAGNVSPSEASPASSASTRASPTALLSSLKSTQKQESLPSLVLPAAAVRTALRTTRAPASSGPSSSSPLFTIGYFPCRAIFLAICLLFVSRRVRSLFMLRMFNDCISTTVCTLAVICLLNHHWLCACLLYSLSVSVKMHTLLYAPAFLFILYFVASQKNVLRLCGYLFWCGLPQLLLGLPFLLRNPVAYVHRSFELTRSFQHQWTVNWAFVPQPLFDSPVWKLVLLSLHLLVLFAFCRRIWLPKVLRQKPKGGGVETRGVEVAGGSSVVATSQAGSSSSVVFTLSVDDMLYILYTCNFIGIIFARSLHYQFYCWYFHTLPFLLLCTKKIPGVCVCTLLVLIEVCWNVYPPNQHLSFLLLLLHLSLLVILFCFAPPSLRQRRRSTEISMKWSAGVRTAESSICEKIESL